jgi:hypothetical protein
MMTALVDLIGRTGATSYRVEHTDPDNGPVVWVAVTEHGDMVSCAAAVTPEGATHGLAALLIDGGACAHCFCPTALGGLRLAGEEFRGGRCWQAFDPVSRRYVRDCETVT